MNIEIEDGGREVQDIQFEYIEGLKKQINDFEDDLKAALDENADLKAENERLRDFAESVVQWSEAYPKKIFTEPTVEQIKQVCEDSGFPMDRIAAMILRKFTKPWGEAARKAITHAEIDG